MDNKDLKGLSEAYNEVYSDNLEQLNGISDYNSNEINEKIGLVGPPRKKIDAIPGVRSIRTAISNAVKASDYSASSKPRVVGSQVVPVNPRENPGQQYVDISRGLTPKPAPRPQQQKPLVVNGRNVFDGTSASGVRNPRPAAPSPQPIQSSRTQRPSTGLATPTSRPTAAPTSRPASPAPRPTAATSSAAPKPATPSTPPMSNMDKWRAANKNLAAAADEKARIRGTSQTDNPLMQSFRNRLPMNSPSVQSPAVAKLGSGNQSLSQNKNAFTAAPPKPTTGIAAVVRPATPSSAAPAKVDTAASRLSTVSKPAIASIENQSGARPFNISKLPSSQTKMKEHSYDFGKPDQITQDVASLYHSIYEGKKKIDQDQDGDNDFADVRIARMVASGMSLKDAIAAVRNKSYNEETELDEGRSENIRDKMVARYGKPASSDTLRLHVARKKYNKAASKHQSGYGPNPRTEIKGKLNPGQLMYKAGQSANVNKEDFEFWVNDLLDEGYDLSDYTWDELYEGYKELPRRKMLNKSNKLRKSGDVNKKARAADIEYQMRAHSPEASKTLSYLNTRKEDFEFWVNDLLDEGYDLSEYTVDEMYEIFEETALERKKAEEERINNRRARVAEMQAQGRVMTPAKRAAAQRAAKAAEKREATLEKAAQATLNDIRGATGRVSEKPMGSEAPESKKAAPEATRRLRTGLKRDTLGSAADAVLKAIRKEEYNAYNLVIGHLLDEGFADDCDSADMMIERMSDEWLNEILESKKWIQNAIKKPGSLSKQLGVPEEDNIPSKMLSSAAKKGGKLGRRARLAQTLKKFH